MEDFKIQNSTLISVNTICQENTTLNVVTIFDAFQEGQSVSQLLSVDCDDLYRNLLKPKIKVGNEFVTQGRTKDQVYFSVGGLCKAIYDKLFKWLVFKCNATLSTKSRKAFFIGVLDIAGFEIFDVSIRMDRYFSKSTCFTPSHNTQTKF